MCGERPGELERGSGCELGKIEICKSNVAKGPLFWLPYQPNPEVGASFRQVVLHEAGHILGLDHPNESQCPGTAVDASIMNSGFSIAHLLYPEIDFLHDYYSLRNSIGRLMFSSDGLSWSHSASNSFFYVAQLMGSFATTNSQSSTNMFIANLARGPVRPIYFSKWNGLSWQDLSVIATNDTNSTPAITSEDDSHLDVVYHAGNNPTTGLQGVFSRTSFNGGLSWTAPAGISTEETETTNPGIAITYDPVSDQFITVWRSSPDPATGTGSHLIYQLGAPGFGGPRTFTAKFASGAPSIACGDPTFVGSYNCLLAWPEANNWRNHTTWQQCKVQGANLKCLGPDTHPYLIVGSPSVSYSHTTSFPWHIAINQGGSATYTWRKGPTSSDSFQDQRSFGFGPKSIPPGAGSRQTNRRYVLVADED